MHAQLAQLVKSDQFDVFETKCLEMIEAQRVSFDALVAPFEMLQKKGQAPRIESLGSMLLAAGRDRAEPRGLLAFLCTLLNANPQNAELRAEVIALYRQLHGGVPAFEALLRASGLESSRLVRRAQRILDTCLSLAEGSYLISRMDDRPAQVVGVDDVEGVYTLRSGARTVALPAAELVSQYDPVGPDDFRVLRQLRPQRVTEMAEKEPMALVIAIIHAHGEALDVDILREELVPRYVAEKDWPTWWKKTLAQLKRSANVQIEGRSPMLLSYSAQAVTLEDETWTAFCEQDDSAKWITTIEGYLRECASRKAPPSDDLLARVHERIAQQIAAARERRPADVFACALVVERLSEQGLPARPDTQGLATALLREAKSPARLISGLEQKVLWDRALALLPAARPSDWLDQMMALIPTAPESAIDSIFRAAIAAGAGSRVQAFVDGALAAPMSNAELVSWIWKNPKACADLSLPSARDIMAKILGTLTGLARAADVDPEAMKNFRTRMKSALSHRSYARFKDTLESIDDASAVTIRRQLERMEGLGDNAPLDMLRILRQTHPQLWIPKRLSPWEEDVLWSTREGYRRKQDEADDLVNVKMRENAKAIGRAAEMGDLSENSEYKFAIEERDLLRARLARLNEELAKARVLEPADVSTDHVGIGTTVELLHTGDGTRRKLTFFGPWDADVDRGIYNYGAPIGVRLMGARLGDRVKLSIEGAEHEFEVTAISNGFDALPAARDLSAARVSAPQPS
ncbi:MAG: Transcription elongation factor GreA [Phycisphaerae bacterium]|nr:Transcription elongation factor GreA [Phycisphaerae bacterium]